MQELSALQALDEAIGARIDSQANAEATTVEIAERHITATKDTTSAVVDQTTATIAGFTELRDQISTLNTQVARLVGERELVTAEP